MVSDLGKKEEEEGSRSVRCEVGGGSYCGSCLVGMSAAGEGFVPKWNCNGVIAQ
jgi:hypothetical protein